MARKRDSRKLAHLYNSWIYNENFQKEFRYATFFIKSNLINMGV